MGVGDVRAWVWEMCGHGCGRCAGMGVGDVRAWVWEMCGVISLPVFSGVGLEVRRVAS